MKKIWWLIPCLIVILALGAVGCAPKGSQIVTPIVQQNTGIWVTGQGEVMAAPDIAELRLGIEAKADTVSKAQTQASEAMHKVMAALKDNGVAEKDIQTQRFSIYPVTRLIKEKDEEVITGYRVTNIVVAKIREIDKAGVIIDAVAKVGGDFTRIRGISFDVKDRTPYYEEARTKAMKDAKNKAIQLANLAGVGLGKATYVSEGAIYWPSPVRDFLEWEGGAPVPAAPTPISPGELKLTVNIQVIYEII